MSPRRSRILLSALALSLAGVAVVPVSAVAADRASARPTCQGKPATIVGSNRPHGQLRGTAGDDVIVSDRAPLVDSRGGSDTICLTGLAGAAFVRVLAGAGDDSVVNRLTGRSVTLVRLGDGADRYVGGDRRDQVLAGTDDDRDRVWTGAGSDLVSARAEDDVDLGGGSDDVVLATTSPAQRLVGGAGADELLVGRGVDTTGWRLDNVTERASRDGATVLRWASFAAFRFTGHDLESFTGGESNDLVQARSIDTTATGGGNDVVIADRLGLVDVGAGDDKVLGDRVEVGLVLGDGNDRVELTVDPYNQLPSYDGGPGRDLFGPRVHVPPPATYPQEMRGDLVTQQITFPGSVVPAIEFARMEGLHLYGPSVTLVGDEQGNHLAADGCHVTIQGAAGDDVLHTALDPFQDYPCAYDVDPTREMWGGAGNDSLRGDVYRDVLHGGAGDDLMRGGDFDDRLIGGPGHDEARGEAGRDACQAERELGCEA